MKKIILVTGSAGFIGFHVSKLLLKNNYNVIGVDNLNNYYSVSLKRNRNKELKNYKNYTFIKIDICKKNKILEICKKYKINYILHLAAQAGVRYSIKNPDFYIKNNLIGFFNVIDAARLCKIKHFVYASSSSVYGLTKKKTFKESDRTDHPVSLYGATKKSNEIIAHSYSYIDDISKAVFKILFKIPKKKKFKTELTSDISLAPFQIYNLGNSKDVKLLEYIKIIETSLEKRSVKKLLKLQLEIVLQLN